MQASELDTTYTQLAQAIHAAGAKSELFLAMLSLKLMSQSEDAELMLRSIESTLHDLQTHEKASHATN